MSKQLFGNDTCAERTDSHAKEAAKITEKASQNAEPTPQNPQLLRLLHQRQHRNRQQKSQPIPSRPNMLASALAAQSGSPKRQQGKCRLERLGRSTRASATSARRRPQCNQVVKSQASTIVVSER